MRGFGCVLLMAASVLGAMSGACVWYDEAPATRPIPPQITIGVFYDELSSYGTWIDVDLYGRVWIPGGIEVGWRPYTRGRWIYTSAGWTWVSAWRWGWAPFHYGRWVLHRRHGWIWIPGRVWAPAWVAWRDGDGWLGWAPLPPSPRWRAGVGLDLDEIDLAVTITPDAWVFVADRDFLDRSVHGRIAVRTRNPELVGRTRAVTRYERDGPRLIDRSVPVQRVERTARRPVPERRIDDLAKPPTPRQRTVRRDRVKVYRPDVRKIEARKKTRGRSGNQPPR